VQMGAGWGPLQFAIIAFLLVLLHFWKFPSWAVVLLGGLLGFLF